VVQLGAASLVRVSLERVSLVRVSLEQVSLVRVSLVRVSLEQVSLERVNLERVSLVRVNLERVSLVRAPQMSRKGRLVISKQVRLARPLPTRQQRAAETNPVKCRPRVSPPVRLNPVVIHRGAVINRPTVRGLGVMLTVRQAGVIRRKQPGRTPDSQPTRRRNVPVVSPGLGRTLHQPASLVLVTSPGPKPPRRVPPAERRRAAPPVAVAVAAMEVTNRPNGRMLPLPPSRNRWSGNNQTSQRFAARPTSPWSIFATRFGPVMTRCLTNWAGAGSRLRHSSTAGSRCGGQRRPEKRPGSRNLSRPSAASGFGPRVLSHRGRCRPISGDHRPRAAGPSPRSTIVNGSRPT